MSEFAPLGVDWLTWHSQRIYNFSEFLKINGYFTNYGFSVWTSCTDCNLETKSLNEGIYLSKNLFSQLPYLLLNQFFGKDALLSFGPIVDKLTIFLSAVIFSEIVLHLLNNKNSQQNYFLFSLVNFIFFIVNPWTYKMIIASWYTIYFVFFIFLGIFFILKEKYLFSLFFFIISGLIDEQSSAGIIVFYIIIKIIIFFKKDTFEEEKNFFLNFNKSYLNKIFLFFSLITVLNIFLRYIASYYLNNTYGSSLFYRIGISGNDIHNGGILGSLQFLGGNRITNCFLKYKELLSTNSFSTDILIATYNCSLSILGMTVFSIISIIGVCLLYKNNSNFRFLIAPISFLILAYIMILQQSLSVHLMGYSYFFSIIFALGITSILMSVLKNNKFYITKFLIVFPCFIGLIFLCIRVNMLTGTNG